MFIGGGGFYICYFMGVMHCIFKNYHNRFFSRCVFEGVSAGGQVAAYAAVASACVGGDDMLHWYINGPRRAAERGGVNVFTLTKSCYDAGLRLHDGCVDSREARQALYERFVCYATTLSGRPCKIARVESATDCAAAMACTGNIPLLGTCALWRCRGTILFDGCLSVKRVNIPSGPAKRVVYFGIDDNDNVPSGVHERILCTMA